MASTIANTTGTLSAGSAEDLMCDIKHLLMQHRDRVDSSKQVVVVGREDHFPPHHINGENNVLIMFPSHEPPEWLERMLGRFTLINAFQFVTPVHGQFIRKAIWPWKDAD